MNLILLLQFPQREHNQISKMFDEETHKDLRGATGAQRGNCYDGRIN